MILEWEYEPRLGNLRWMSSQDRDLPPVGSLCRGADPWHVECWPAAGTGGTNGGLPGFERRTQGLRVNLNSFRTVASDVTDNHSCWSLAYSPVGPYRILPGHSGPCVVTTFSRPWPSGALLPPTTNR